MMIHLIIILCYQARMTPCQFNLYQTDKSQLMSVFGYDCLYYHGSPIFDSIIDPMPFCRRPQIFEHLNEQMKSCDGEKITFEQLKFENVTTSTLLWWNTAIETIESYEKYLLSDKLVAHDDQYYCNCSSLTKFGKSCQYYIDTDDTKRSFTHLVWMSRRNVLRKEAHNDYFTCYVGIRCSINLFCLDWRQICNGIVDCDHGEDEPVELCSQMELNQCDDDKEFRCQNGMCIPISMAFQFDGCCLDRSDRKVKSNDQSLKYFSDLCLAYPSFECDTTNHGWKRFPCQNGQFISFQHLTFTPDQQHPRCANDRHLMYLRQLFSPENEDPCWRAMICLSGFDYLYPHINCFREDLVEMIKDYCPTEYYFPPNSVVYSFVFFLYDKINHVNWMESAGPDYICYKKEYCPTNNFLTASKNHFECFTVNQAMFSWENFYEYVAYLFSSCFETLSPDGKNDKLIYRCDQSNTYVSIYRVKNKEKDCYFNEDEHPDIDLCALERNDLFRCLAYRNECVPLSFVHNQQYDCIDGSDEYLEATGTHCSDTVCGFRHWSKRSLDEIYRFSELCDKIVNRHLFISDSNETDETDCEYWPYTCNSLYTKCNRVWNCPNGRDEITCVGKHHNNVIRKALQCTINEFYCIRLTKDNYKDLNASCINMNKTGDGIIDCIGGTDEQFTSICSKQHPYDFKRRFLCANSSLCITLDQVCDTIPQCAWGDDERICPWLIQNGSTTFSCNSTLTHLVVRCDASAENNKHCQIGEHLWFCDLIAEGESTSQTPRIAYEPYPPLNQNFVSISMKTSISLTRTKTFSFVDAENDLSLCNLGYLVRSSIDNKKSYCFCPPAYYGDYCQYQSERLIVSLKIQVAYPVDTSTVFRLIVYLLNEEHTVISHDETVYDLERIKDGYFYHTDLIYERVINMSLRQRPKSRFVHVDSYIIKTTSVQYITSWFFPVSFPFLPVNELVAQLSLRNELFRVRNCKRRCGSHGRCMYYINMRDLEYCWCERGWLGDRCQMKSSSNLCNPTSCAAYSECVILNEEKKQTKCVCPLGRSGDRCYIKHNSCEDVHCQNNGTCLPLDQRNFEFHCACDNDHVGTYCENTLQYSHISIDRHVTDVSVVPAIILLITDSDENEILQHKRILYKNITLPTILKIHGRGQLGLIKMFHSWSNISYYMVFMQEVSMIRPYINSSVITKNRCKNISEVFNQTILSDYSYLRRLKLYHLPCQHDYDLRCFFDEYRLCLCTRTHNASCYLFNHEYGSCDYCQNGGVCLQQNTESHQWVYTCLCRKCSDGSLCQFSPANYFITLDILIGSEIQVGNVSFREQPTIVYLTLVFILIILSFSLIFNTIGMIIFSRKKVRQVGCDLYLFYLTVVSALGLIFLFLRFLYTIITQMYIVENTSFVQVSCISLEYLLRVIPSLFDWLTVCISIERAYTVVKDVQFTKIIAAKTLKLSRWIILIVFLFNILTTLHRPFHLKLVDQLSFADEPQGHPWCVLDFGETRWNIYEKVINVCHMIIPLIANMVSVIAFQWHKIKLELTSATRGSKSTKYIIIKEQLLKYKPLIIGPSVIIILEIPRLVLTFGLACIENNWQRYVYLIGYLISYLPLTGIVFIYIIPSPKYNAQLKTIVKRTLRLLSIKKQRKTEN